MGDRLARIERYWRGDGAVAEQYEMVRDVLALVEIAKAARARVQYTHSESCWFVRGINPPCKCDCGHDALLDALSALDGDEGTA